MTALDEIHSLAHERLNLYRLAGQQKLTEAQAGRIQQITGLLEVKWDQHRRELIGEGRVVDYKAREKANYDAIRKVA